MNSRKPLKISTDTKKGHSHPLPPKLCCLVQGYSTLCQGLVNCRRRGGSPVAPLGADQDDNRIYEEKLEKFEGRQDKSKLKTPDHTSIVLATQQKSGHPFSVRQYNRHCSTTIDSLLENDTHPDELVTQYFGRPLEMKNKLTGTA